MGPSGIVTEIELLGRKRWVDLSVMRVLHRPSRLSAQYLK
jgi:hypothetical protein